MHPILFNFGGIPIYTYGVLVAAGVLLSLWYGRRQAPRAGVDPDKLWNMGIYFVLVALVVAKIWLVLSAWDYYFANPREIFSLATFQSGGTFYGGLVGGGRLAWPEGAREDEAPPWLVFGATVRTVAMSDAASALRPLEAALEDEGFDDLGSGRLVESFARQLMVLIDAWQESGFGMVAQSYLARLPAEASVERTIDGAGDLLVRRKGKRDVKKHRLLPALAAPAWLDPHTGGPK